jgi:hypothetical protein
MAPRAELKTQRVVTIACPVAVVNSVHRTSVSAR